jgi:hypothetical protein
MPVTSLKSRPETPAPRIASRAHIRESMGSETVVVKTSLNGGKNGARASLSDSIQRLASGGEHTKTNHTERYSGARQVVEK